MKYCIFKGVEGFGDRISCLIHAIEYCYFTERTLVIDWRDRHWTQGKYIPIYKYLKIHNIECIDIMDFLQYQYKHSMSIVSKQWKEKILETKFEKYLYRDKFKLENNNQIIFEIIADKKKDFKEDIVVYNGVGGRSWKKKFKNFIDFDASIYKLLKEIYETNNTERKNYICIHMRITSKSWEHEKRIKKQIKENIHKLFPCKKKYFEYINEELKKIKETLPVLVVSDCTHTAKEWVAQAGVGIVLSNEQIKTHEKSGIHLINVKSLGEMYKHNLNMICLRDFCLMKESKYLISDPASYFSRMANFFKK